MSSLHLTVQAGILAVCRLASDAPLPSWSVHGPLISITRTADELSIVCPEERVPEGTTIERGWRSLKVEGPLDFALTGILVRLTTPLATAAISVFCFSTFDTDYVLIQRGDESRAIAAWRGAGIETPQIYPPR